MKFEHNLISNEWNSGFVAEARVTNVGTSAITQDWSIAFQFTDGSSVVNSWNGQISGSNPYTITPNDWNKVIEPGSATIFGMQANKGSSGLAAQTPSINGVICN